MHPTALKLGQMPPLTNNCKRGNKILPRYPMLQSLVLITYLNGNISILHHPVSFATMDFALTCFRSSVRRSHVIKRACQTMLLGKYLSAPKSAIAQQPAHTANAGFSRTFNNSSDLYRL